MKKLFYYKNIKFFSELKSIPKAPLKSGIANKLCGHIIEIKEKSKQDNIHFYD